jgi:hypothetical protein
MFVVSIQTRTVAQRYNTFDPLFVFYVIVLSFAKLGLYYMKEPFPIIFLVSVR